MARSWDPHVVRVRGRATAAKAEVVDRRALLERHELAAGDGVPRLRGDRDEAGKKSCKCCQRSPNFANFPPWLQRRGGLYRRRPPRTTRPSDSAGRTAAPGRRTRAPSDLACRSWQGFVEVCKSGLLALLRARKLRPSCTRHRILASSKHNAYVCFLLQESVWKIKLYNRYQHETMPSHGNAALWDSLFVTSIKKDIKCFYWCRKTSPV